MKNKTKAKKIIQAEIEKYSILKPTSMAKDIIEALLQANLISSNLPVSGRFFCNAAANDVGGCKKQCEESVCEHLYQECAGLYFCCKCHEPKFDYPLL